MANAVSCDDCYAFAARHRGAIGASKLMKTAMIQQRAVDGIDDASCVSSAKRKLEKLASACVLAGSAGTARAIGEL